MTNTGVQLIVIAGVCSLTCLLVAAIIWGEAHQIKKARIAVRSQLATNLSSLASERPSLEAARFSPNRARQREMIRRSKHAKRLHDEYQELGKIGFTHSQIARLIIYRTAYRIGHFHPDPLMPGRLGFMRWLYRQGKIDS